MLAVLKRRHVALMEPVPRVRMFADVLMATTDQSAIKLLKVPPEMAQEELSIKSCRGEVSRDFG